jgi:hypothetical protein
MKLATLLRSLSILATLAVHAGCVAGGQDESDDPFDLEGGLEPSGIRLNGISLQGISLQGISLQGVRLNGTSLDDVTLVGVSYQTGTSAGALPLAIDAGELVAPQQGGTLLRGEALEGTTLTGVLSDGGTLALRIDDVQPTDDSRIFHYHTSYWDGSGWTRLCGSPTSTIPALALAGRWDESSGTATGGAHIDDPGLFTLACTSAAVAKCVEAGYAPWLSVAECSGSSCQTISMRAMHQACTRMFRADYCGDGTPHTVNGTPINLWDNFGVQERDDEAAGTWSREAEWSAGGALCILNLRWEGPASEYIDTHCPERWVSPAFGCFGEDSTFFTEYGHSTPIQERSLLRNEFTHDTP